MNIRISTRNIGLVRTLLKRIILLIKRFACCKKWSLCAAVLRRVREAAQSVSRSPEPCCCYGRPCPGEAPARSGRQVGRTCSGRRGCSVIVAQVCCYCFAARCCWRHYSSRIVDPFCVITVGEGVCFESQGLRRPSSQYAALYYVVLCPGHFLSSPTSLIHANGISVSLGAHKNRP